MSEEDYVSIRLSNDGKYYLRPYHGWSMIIKSTYSVAKGHRQLGKCIEHWMIEGYKVFKFE